MVAPAVAKLKPYFSRCNDVGFDASSLDVSVDDLDDPALPSHEFILHVSVYSGLARTTFRVKLGNVESGEATSVTVSGAHISDDDDSDSGSDDDADTSGDRGAAMQTPQQDYARSIEEGTMEALIVDPVDNLDDTDGSSSGDHNLDGDDDDDDDDDDDKDAGSDDDDDTLAEPRLNYAATGDDGAGRRWRRATHWCDCTEVFCARIHEVAVGA